MQIIWLEIPGMLLSGHQTCAGTRCANRNFWKGNLLISQISLEVDGALDGHREMTGEGPGP
mgnify:FL=1